MLDSVVFGVSAVAPTFCEPGRRKLKTQKVCYKRGFKNGQIISSNNGCASAVG